MRAIVLIYRAFCPDKTTGRVRLHDGQTLDVIGIPNILHEQFHVIRSPVGWLRKFERTVALGVARSLVTRIPASFPMESTMLLYRAGVKRYSPVQSPSCLVFGHTSFKEVFLLG